MPHFGGIALKEIPSGGIIKEKVLMAMLLHGGRQRVPDE